MRLLIANVIDSAIRQGGDASGYIQRVLWLAESGDLVVLPTEPDQAFLGHVAEITGRGRDAIQVEVVPGSLLDAAAAIGRYSGITEILPLWPSRAVGRLALEAGLADRLAGCHFFAQGGGELVNSKAVFRALAAAADVPVAPGGVCYAPDEGAAAVREITGRGRSSVIKQAHNGSGNGNEIVSANCGTTTHVGARHSYVLDGRPGAIEQYWRDRWSWASAGGRFPVVVEELLPDCRSVYAEYHISDAAVAFTGSGALIYADRILDRQTVPIPATIMPQHSQDELIAAGLRLARHYRDVGYRGYLSADALVDDSGGVWFTEVNAQVSGSVHLYHGVAAKVVDCAAEPNRAVSEFRAPPLRRGSVEEFLNVILQADLCYSAETRTGIIITVPPPKFDRASDELAFSIVFDTESAMNEMLGQLSAALRDAMMLA